MTMPETYYKTGKYEINPSTFGGIILPLDYNTEYSASKNIASRIVATQKFDNWCRNNKGNIYRLLEGRNKKND